MKKQLNTAMQSSLSRRQWLEQVSLPLIGTSIGASAFIDKVNKDPHLLYQESANDLGARIYNIRDFGAKGDGEAMDTDALQAAINQCSNDGGGTVLVPAGIFQIGITELKNNITLHIAAGGTLLGTDDGTQYHAINEIPLKGDSTLGDGNWSLLYAVNAKNITIEGPGTIDGQGQQFRSLVRGEKPPSGIGGAQRPYHMLFYRCTNIAVRNLDLIRCAFHSIRVIQSKRVHMDNLYIHSRVNTNNDGFHFISCEFVSINNCTLLVQDDACALFGSCKNITVTNCVFSTRWSIFRFGGGSAQNIAVSNCIIYETYGCPVKISSSQSQMENMTFSNLIMKDVTGPIGIGFSGSSGRGREDGGADAMPASYVRDISISNIRATVVARPPKEEEGQLMGTIYDGEQNSCITLNGVGDAMIENISFSDVHVIYAGGGTAELAAKREIPQVAREYFGVWAEPPLGPPAYGLFARNVKGLTMNNIRLEVMNPDFRPAVIFSNVQDAVINGLSAQGNTEADSLFRFSATKDVLLTACRAKTPVPVFLQMEGTENENIIIDGGDLSKAVSPLAFKNGANNKSVKLRV
jgi:polygalacturonase